MSKYTDWVRAQRCIVTGAIGDNVDPHHIKGYSWLTGSSGSAKGGDILCIPLRHDIHMELHDIGWESWEEKWNRSQLEEAVRILMKAHRLGILTINL